MEATRTLGAGQRGGRAVQHAARARSAVAPVPGARHDLDVGQREGAQADAERLHDGLLGREAGRQALGRGPSNRPASARSASVKSRAAKPGPAGQHAAEPRHVDGVDTHADDAAAKTAAHSTVTVLARLRGRSTSCPCRRARR